MPVTKRLATAALLALSVMTPRAPAQEPPARPAWAREFLEVRLEALERADVVALVARGFDVTDVRGGTVRVSLPAARLPELRALGHDPSVVPHPLDVEPALAADYPTHAELTARLLGVAADHPDLCRLESVGESVQGREQWIMKISDNPDLQEDEPEFRWISSLHGDEVVGMEMCLRLIDELTDGHGSDAQVTSLVDELEIWILPMANPDGFAAGSRYNAHGVDLNRDFPDRVSDPVNTTAGRQPETEALMEWSFAHSPVLSANLHGGTLVCNYPYDNDPNPFASYSACPDDALVISQSLSYSELNGPMYYSPFFQDGITNGVAWYAIDGGYQDWNYVWQGCNDLTIEIGDDKWPPYHEMTSYWVQNRDAMLAYMQRCLEGARGVVTDAVSGQPVAATVRVAGVDHDVYADPDVGDYQRMLLPGTYALEFSAPGYADASVTGVFVGAGPAVRVDVQLAPLGWSDVGGGLAGSGGSTPALSGAGPLVAGGQVQLALGGALPAGSSTLVLGLGALSAPFKGGTLVPTPDVVVGGLPVDGDGALTLTLTWPAGIPPGAALWWQHWISDAGGPAGYAASNGLRSVAQ